MLRTRWLWWLAGGLVLALALLIVSPLAAQSSAPSAQQTAPAVCPLSDEQTQKATKAFEQLAHTFTTEPRCVNCHGGVDPFGPDAGKTHGGGEQDKIFKPVSIVDQVLIKLGIKTATDVVDEDATNGQCQTCHAGLPGWKLAPPGDVFKGKTAVELCKNQKVVFGKRDGPVGFVNHIDHDVFNVKFINNAFLLGDRGLDFETIKTIKGFRLEKPTIKHEELNALAKQWADALGKKFQGDDECGCKPHHYALFLDEVSDFNLPTVCCNPEISVSTRSSGQVQMPLTFKDDGSFTGSGDEQRVLNMSWQQGRWDRPGHVSFPARTCSGTGPQTLSWSLSGSVEGSDVNTPGIMHIRISVDDTYVVDFITCRDGGPDIQGYVPYLYPTMITMPDIQALVGETSSISFSLPLTTGGTGSFDLKLTIRQLD